MNSHNLTGGLENPAGTPLQRYTKAIEKINSTQLQPHFFQSPQLPPPIAHSIAYSAGGINGLSVVSNNLHHCSSLWWIKWRAENSTIKAEDNTMAFRNQREG